MSDRLGNTVVALLAGAVVGAGLGILFAPAEGKKTRKKIKKTFDDSKDDLGEKIDELKKQVRETVSKKKHDFEEGLEGIMSTTGKKRDEVISTLEKKLAELKTQANEAVESAKK